MLSNSYLEFVIDADGSASLLRRVDEQSALELARLSPSAVKHFLRALLVANVPIHLEYPTIDDEMRDLIHAIKAKRTPAKVVREKA